MKTIRDGRQLWIMIGISLVCHIILVGGWVFWYTFSSQATPDPRLTEAPIVDLYDISELPEQIFPEVEKREIPSQEIPEEQLVALETIPTVLPLPTTTPTPTPMPRPTITPVPTSTPLPRPTSTPRPRLRPTATPIPRPVVTFTPVITPSPPLTPQEAVAALEVPRRQAVMPSQPDSEAVQRAIEQEQAITTNTENARQHALTFSDRLSRETPLLFETESDFPYPEYLLHIKEKIEGLWFPEGSGTVAVFMIIERNGKILQSGVDKGTGLEVNKLRESVVRAMTLIKRFEPLPNEYTGSTLRIRITVRR